MRRTELPLDEKMGGGASKPFRRAVAGVESVGRLAWRGALASICACSGAYGGTGATATFCGRALQHEPLISMPTGPQLCIMPRQQAGCPAGCIASRQADTGATVHKTTTANIRHAPFLLQLMTGTFLASSPSICRGALSRK